MVPLPPVFPKFGILDIPRVEFLNEDHRSDVDSLKELVDVLVVLIPEVGLPPDITFLCLVLPKIGEQIRELYFG